MPDDNNDNNDNTLAERVHVLENRVDYLTLLLEKFVKTKKHLPPDFIKDLKENNRV